MTGKVEKILDIVTFGLYNIRINKNNYGRKFMADATAKNYTDEMVEHMVAVYEDTPTLATVEALVTEFGKPKRSIISKLSSLGVYKAQPRNTTKKGTPVVRKAELVAQIEDALGTQLFLSSLTKASKADLETLLAIIETNNGAN
tara:strand:+ start:123 stop:554 length:432 start_codon:yes stop_codon:yes gene_type:complete